MKNKENAEQFAGADFKPNNGNSGFELIKRHRLCIGEAAQLNVRCYQTDEEE